VPTSEQSPPTEVPSETKEGPTATALVWDFPLRAFHWLLASCLVGSWITAEAGYDYTELHFLLGYSSLALILFRLIWGVCGTTYSRFGQFLRGPRTTIESIRSTWTRTPSTHTGHGPAGGIASVALILVVAIQAGTGLFISDDIFWAGPYNGAVSSDLAGTLAQVHHINFNVLQALVFLHLCAIAWYTWGKRQNISKSMLTGRKAIASAQTGIAHSKLVTALIVAGFAAGAIWLLITLAPPPPAYY